MSNYIDFNRLATAVRRNAAARGWRGDIYARSDELPDCGTYRQEWEIVDIIGDVADVERGLDCRARVLVRRLARAAVLGPQSESFKLQTARPTTICPSPLDHDAKLAREWRRKR
ncbi:MAG TPA: hypothetical protein VFV87_10390 [Pirellulaceae bacterium]|nr:hypothetical protein [Pirellulaceae bacterium]